MNNELRRAVVNALETSAFWLLLITVVLAPLPFGSNGPESMMALAVMSGIVLVIFCASKLLGSDGFSIEPSLNLTVALIAFAMFALWGLFQLVPWISTPLAHPLWSQRTALLGLGGKSGTISIDPELTWNALVKTGGYFAIATSAALLLRDPRRRRTACSALVVAGGLYAAYGLVEWSLGDCCVVWQKKTAYQGVVTGPFINRNSFATYLGLVALVCLGHILREMGELRHVTAPGLGRRLSARLMLLISRRWMMIAAFLVLAAALLFTLSRAGVTSFVLGAATLVLLLSHAKLLGAQRRLLYVSIFAGVAGLTIVAFGGALLGRIANEGVEDVDRTQSWRVVISGIEASPWLGHGFGTFPEAFPLYRDDRLDSRRYWDKAQDTYLELALDVGIPATGVFLIGLGALALQCIKGLSRRRKERRIFPAIGLASMVLIAAHSIFDFSMQIPAVATTFAFIIGMAITESGIWRAKPLPQSSETCMR